MKYINAKDLLPDALVKELQRYMQGGYLYIPADQAQKKRWGEASGYRQELQQRNRQIVAEFQKNIACLYRPFAKSSIRNKQAGAAEMQLLLLCCVQIASVSSGV